MVIGYYQTTPGYSKQRPEWVNAGPWLKIRSSDWEEMPQQMVKHGEPPRLAKTKSFAEVTSPDLFQMCHFFERFMFPPQAMILHI